MGIATIAAIDRASVHRICSGQVILDLSIAVKELVENALDADATAIEVRFKDHGLEQFEVTDNGTGIDKDNYAQIALKHHTSKIKTFSDLDSVSSFGFRGEALSSLCALGKVSVTTCTADQAPRGTRLDFDSHGRILSETPAGTTVQVQDLFYALPVRHKELKRNIKKEYAKTLSLMQAYALIARNVRFSVTNPTGKSKAISTNGNNRVQDNITNVFGARAAASLVPFDLALSVHSDESDEEPDGNVPDNLSSAPASTPVSKDTDALSRVRVVGFMSKPIWGNGRSTADRQYVYVNGRPCNLPKIVRCFNDAFHEYVSHQYPCIIVDLRLEHGAYDVNVSPDKRTIFLHYEREIVLALHEDLRKMFEPSRGTYATDPAANSRLSVTGSSTRAAWSVESPQTPATSSEADEEIRYSATASKSESESNTSTLRPTRKRASPEESESDMADTQRAKRLRLSQSISDLQQFKSPIGNSLAEKTSTLRRVDKDIEQVSLLRYVKYHAKQVSNITTSPTFRQSEEGEGEEESSDSSLESSEVLDEGDNERNTVTGPKVTTGQIAEQEEPNRSPEAEEETEEEHVTYKEIKPLQLAAPKRTPIASTTNQQVRINTQIAAIRSRYTRYYHESRQSKIKMTSNNELTGAGVDHSEDEANQTLNKVISKSDFTRMMVLGQFNLGFIIALLATDGRRDLFIIDQHASDEKYNFETLQQTTVIQSQKLFVPRALELTAGEEIIAAENEDIIAANGYEIEVHHDAPPTQRIKLLAQPVSKSTVFGIKDLEELIYLLSEHPGEMVRCSKARAMFASRACRKSVMIGHTLNKSKMIQIVKHMGEIKQPWNCPHGRPTMRHLMDLGTIPMVTSIERPLTFTGTAWP
ncbi:hypothetical protein BZG36_02984 [Bifiguratus adelaidae]|uniref:DNA mismatch repair protein PMS1 n=1 Tax=Bifiguratus adelaidae TaxID=1938954 RepID=A0A261XYC4_9FUNG|nr:hypothetical protein BZG36_02984 [Bifiguratus adelaidae]